MPFQSRKSKTSLNTQRKEKLHALNNKSTVFVKHITLHQVVPGLAITTYFPKSSVDKDAKKAQDHSLIPSRKSIVLPAYHAHDLIKTLQRILPKIESLESPEAYFPNFSWPKGATVYFNNKEKFEESSSDSSKDEPSKRKQKNANKKTQKPSNSIEDI